MEMIVSEMFPSYSIFVNRLYSEKKKDEFIESLAEHRVGRLNNNTLQRQYLITCKTSRYCTLLLHGRIESKCKIAQKFKTI